MCDVRHVELVGTDGEVTTIDIDPDMSDRARSFLAEVGYDYGVNFVLSDGEEGSLEHASYDRTIVTAGAWTL